MDSPEKYNKENTTLPGSIFFTIGIIILIYSFCWGLQLARLRYYGGNFGAPLERITILPKFIQAQEKRGLQAPAAAPHSLRHRRTSHNVKSKESQAEHNEDSDERQRMVKLDVFEQDDCGDGSSFPNVPIADHHSALASLEARQHPAFRAHPPDYMTMGLRKMDRKDWLTIDNTYERFHGTRSTLLAEKRNECIQVLPEAEMACEELMREVVAFLVERYPGCFQIVNTREGEQVRNEIRKEEFRLERPWDVHPLEMCARLAMEDFNILKKGEFTGEHYL